MLTPRLIASIGLLADLIGAFLLAYDLLRPRVASTEAPKGAVDLVVGVIDALLGPEAERHAALTKSQRDALVAAARTSEAQLHLRRAGRVGILLLLIGFTGQLTAALITMGSTEPSEPHATLTTHARRV